MLTLTLAMQLPPCNFHPLPRPLNQSESPHRLLLPLFLLLLLLTYLHLPLVLLLLLLTYLPLTLFLLLLLLTYLPLPLFLLLLSLTYLNLLPLLLLLRRTCLALPYFKKRNLKTTVSPRCLRFVI